MICNRNRPFPNLEKGAEESATHSDSLGNSKKSRSTSRNLRNSATDLRIPKKNSTIYKFKKLDEK